MNKIIYILIIVSTSFSYSLRESYIRDAKRVNDLLINCDFNTAYKLSDEYLSADSSEPLYYYLKLASIGLEVLDRDKIVKKPEFESTFEYGVSLLESKETLNSYETMLLGFLYSSYSSFKLLEGKYLTAVSAGKKGLNLIEEAREKDSTNYDLDYYLGFFSYARGELKKRVPILFWLDDSSKEGIMQLKRCSKKGLFMNNAADMVLVDVLIREGEISQGDSLLTKLLQAYPNSRFLFWTEARKYEALSDSVNTFNTYKKLSDNYSKVGFVHNSLETALLAMDFCTDNKENNLKKLLSQFDYAELGSEDKKLYTQLEGKK